MKSWFYREFFRIRPGLAIFSLLLAFGIWIVVNSGQAVQEKRSVKIQYTKMPATLTFERTPVKEVSLGLLGPLYRIRSLRDEDLTYTVDLSEARSGANRIELTLDALRLPLDLEASFPSPHLIYVYLEALETKTLPVKALIVGAPAEGFSVGEIHFNPAQVRAAGPRSQIAKFDSAPLEIPVEGKKATFSVTGKPRLNSSTVQIDESVYAEVEVSPVKVTKTFENVPVVVEGSESGAREVKIEPAIAAVEIEGGQKDLQSVNWAPQVVISVKDLKRGKYLLRGRVDLPPGLKAAEIRPQNFVVEVIK